MKLTIWTVGPPLLVSGFRDGENAARLKPSTLRLGRAYGAGRNHDDAEGIGRDRADLGVACHGEVGISADPGFPHRAAQRRKFIHLRQAKGAEAAGSSTMHAMAMLLKEARFVYVAASSAGRSRIDGPVAGKQIVQ